MLRSILFYTGSVLTLIWGVSHLFPTRSVVRGFGKISQDNQQIITMEWILEGVFLIFIGTLGIGLTIIGPDGIAARFVFITCSVFLFITAIISLFTGFRVNFLPYKLCPFIFSTSALLFLIGVLL